MKGNKMSILGLLGILLIGLKLANVGVVAGWSWWLVTLPLWGGLALMLAFMTFGLVVTVLCAPKRYRFSKR